MIRILIFIVFAGLSINSFSQTYWKIENEYGDEILLTIEMNNAQNTFEAYTRKDALKDIAGTFTWTLAKTAGKLKYPEIVLIEWNGKKLPFKPFEISKINPRSKTTAAKNVSSFREFNSKTFLFDANTLPATKTAFDSIAVFISKKGQLHFYLTS